MNDDQKKTLLKLARDSIASRFNRGQVDPPAEPEFQQKRGLFVSLHLEGDLRGCIGLIEARQTIARGVFEMAREAAFGDPRFPPLRRDELDRLEIEISVLSELIPVTDISGIVIGRDGLLLRQGFRSGVFLPQVPVEWNWDLHTYLTQLCRKAGLPDGTWKRDDARLFRFEAEVFSESHFLP
ncbi:MAG: AmmeMemoRadiSam system protein A [Candidatus Cloacimonetes bacterium]|nr:AmmeMemoRadiSam system protein A [Candidatus Cloacimonadota bacterium]